MTEVLPARKSLGAVLNAVLDDSTRSQHIEPILELAQWFVDHEIAVVPTKDKQPIGGVQKANLNIAGIKDQYGIALGNGIIGIDFDEYHGAENISLFGVTRRWRSGSGKGYGILLRVPKELSEHGFNLSKGIDVRGANQILVGPGSKHPSGGTYQLIQDIEIIDAPPWLMEILKKKNEEVNSNEIVLGDYVKPERFFNDENWVAKFEVEPIKGERSSQVSAIIWYSIERGATNEELAWIISNHRAALDKGNSWVKGEIARFIKKARLLHEHPGKPCDSAGCKNRPDWMKKQLAPIDFFSARPEFAYIRQAAFSRLVNEKAVFMAVLCRLATAIPTEVVLPPIVGKKASLNFFVCFVGESSDGKGTSTGLAEELFDFKQTGMTYIKSTPGSGEGVVSTYLKIKDNKWQQEYESALINFDEIDNLKASSDRQGSTLSAILRQAFMGEQIGGTYSKSVKELLPHSYRMALQLSAQPLRSAGLLEDSDGGLPQRFVFVQTAKTEFPDVDDLPEFPAPLAWRAPQRIIELKNRKNKAKEPNPILNKLDTESELAKEYIEIELDPAIIREIKVNRIARLRSGSAGINGHADLVHLKVSSLLAILAGRMNVTIEDAMLAKVVMNWSKQALNDIKDALAHKKLKEQMARSTARADQAVVIENRLANIAVERVANNIIRKVSEGHTMLKGTDGFKIKIKATDRHLIPEALEWIEANKKGSFDKIKEELILK